MASTHTRMIPGASTSHFLAALLCLGLSGCGTLPSSGHSDFSYKNMPVAAGSAVSARANNALFQGTP